LDPIRERRRQLAEHPAKLQEIIQKGAQKATAVAEETMTAARKAVGLLGIADAANVVSEQERTGRMKVPESATRADNAQQRRDLVIDAWVEKVSKTTPLRKDRPRIFITRKGRKVGIDTVKVDPSGLWQFSFPKRPLNVITLLAEDADGFVHDHVLPPKFVQQYWSRFPSTQDGQAESVLIHARRTANGLAIVLEDSSVPIQEYTGNYSALE
jgi:hypothetical protein